jgi:hypothetical protein
MNMKRIFKRAWSACFLIGLMAAAASAQKSGTTALQFLKVMPTARATAMGDAFAAMSSGVDAVYWNPAGLVSVGAHDFSSTYTLWLFDTKQTALAYGMNLGEYGSIGAQFQMTDIGEIEETRVDMIGIDATGNYREGATGNTFAPKSFIVGLSYAKQLTDRFATGVSVKYAHESLWDGQIAAPVKNPGDTPELYTPNGKVVLFDFGMFYNTGFHTVRLGASVQNFGGQVRFAQEDYPAPLQFRLGIAGDLIGADGVFTNSENTRLTLAYDILQPNDYDQQMHVGLEAAFMDIFFLRGGYKYNYDNEKFTFGGGVKTDVSGAVLAFDYSYGSMGVYLGNVHRISVGVQLK